MTVDGGQRTPFAWAGPNPFNAPGAEIRLEHLLRTFYWGSSAKITPMTGFTGAPYSYVIVSPAVNMLAERVQLTLPDLRTFGLIYDNGLSRVYFRPPEARK
jgi:hypothetical protein